MENRLHNLFYTLGFADFVPLRDAVKEQADLMALSSAMRMDVTYRPETGLGGEMEKANLQYVSGRMFGEFGLRPALGRLLNENDDQKPGANAVVMLSYDYWRRRFGRDPKVLGRRLLIGRRFGIGSDLFEIVGVAEEKFTGTEPGLVTDAFTPTMMSALMIRPEAAWLQAYIRLKPGVAIGPVREHLNAAYQAIDQGRGRASRVLVTEPAGGGFSRMQMEFRVPLAALGGLVAMVLLIACVNVANLMTAQAAARGREMALRGSIGAGRMRLMQLVLVEAAMLACLGAGGGAVLAWWSAPMVARGINPPDNPARLTLSMDWRLIAFSLTVTLGVTAICGLLPALRASAVKPAQALKGGGGPQSLSRLMHGLIAVQIAFCFVVLFTGGMFAETFQRLSRQDNGFSAERILNVNVVTGRAEPPEFWDQVMEHLRRVPGVEMAALADWPLLDGYAYKFNEISVNGAPPTKVTAAFMNVAPGWIREMKIPLVAGRDFEVSDLSPGAAIVNEAFAREYFGGGNPVGEWFAGTSAYMKGQRFRIVGLVRDVRYRDLRRKIMPVAYTPFRRLDAKGAVQPIVEGTFVVRTAGPNVRGMESVLRKEVAAARPGFRVSSVRTQEDLIDSQTVRERLLAVLAVFFGCVAALLAGLGLYGVLEYSVVERRREIGIRMALGAQARDVAQQVTGRVFAMILVGAICGVGLGLSTVRYVGTLLYEVKPTEVGVLALPSLAILVAALFSALPAVMKAVRIDPVALLRAE